MQSFIDWIYGIALTLGGPGLFGVKFDGYFDLARLAPKKERRAESTLVRPWYVERRTA